MPLPVSEMSPRAIGAMAVAAVGLVLAGAFAAFTSGDDDAVTTLVREDGEEVTETDDTAASDQAAAPAAPGDTTPSSDPGGTQGAEASEPAGGTDSPAEAAPPPSAAADADPPASSSRQLRPVPAGTYEYDTDGTVDINGDRRPLPDTTTVQVPEADADGRQTTTQDFRDGNGDGSVSETTLRFAPEGVFLERIHSTVFLNSGTFSQSTTLTPTEPFLLIPADAGAGTKTAGRLTGDGITADVTFEIVSVGADTTISRLVADLSGEVEGRQTSELTTRTSDLLTLKEVGESDVRSGPFRVQSNYTATLR